MSSVPGRLPPLPPPLLARLQQVAQEAEGRRTGLIPPPPADPAIEPDRFVDPAELDANEAVNRLNLASRLGSELGRQPTNSLERFHAEQLEEQLTDFVVIWSGADSLALTTADGVASRIQGLTALVEALAHFHAIRGALPGAEAHAEALRQAVALVRPAQAELKPLVHDILAGRVDDTRLMVGEALALTRRTTRVPDVLRELAQRFRADPVTQPDEVAERLERLAIQLGSVRSDDDADDALEELDSIQLTLEMQPRKSACQPYLTALYLALDGVHRNLDEVDLHACDDGS